MSHNQNGNFHPQRLQSAADGHNRFAESVKSKGRIRVGRIIGRRYRFVDDYKKTVYVGANGKPKQKIRYIGQWVCPQNEQGEFSRIVLMSRIAAGAALAAVIAALLTVPLPMDNRWYVPLTAAAFFPLIYAVMGVALMPNQAKPMERQRFHKSFERAKGAAIACLIVLGLAVIAAIVCWILVFCGVIVEIKAFTFRDGAYAFCMLLSAAANIALILENRKLKTELKENDAYKPE